jgi:hypothetical protein
MFGVGLLALTALVTYRLERIQDHLRVIAARLDKEDE